MAMQITYHLAMAAGRDAANRRMAAAGRVRWPRGIVKAAQS